MSDPQLEQGVIDSFRRVVEAHGTFHDAIWESFSLGGQDRYVASDYIFSDSSNFCLIEFKDRGRLLSTEGGKYIAGHLCKELSKNSLMLELSKHCHHIAWQEGTDIVSAPYAEIVCCRNNFPNLHLLSESADFTNKRTSSIFCDGFNLPPPRVNIQYEDFIKYIDLLTSFSGKSSSDIVVISDNINIPHASTRPPSLVVKRLKGVQAIKEWMDSKMPIQKPKRPRVF